MADDQHVIAGRDDVAFDRVGTLGDRSLERRPAVIGMRCAAAAMRDDAWRRHSTTLRASRFGVIRAWERPCALTPPAPAEPALEPSSARSVAPAPLPADAARAASPHDA